MATREGGGLRERLQRVLPAIAANCEQAETEPRVPEENVGLLREIGFIAAEEIWRLGARAPRVRSLCRRSRGSMHHNCVGHRFVGAALPRRGIDVAPAPGGNLGREPRCAHFIFGGSGRQSRTCPWRHPLDVFVPEHQIDSIEALSTGTSKGFGSHPGKSITPLSPRIPAWDSRL